MKLFLSWSGERSRGIAQTLRQTLPLMMNSADPWISDSDIEKGERWNSVLAGVLDNAKVGIFCLTPSNIIRPALLFEAGAISKSVTDARVCVLLDGIEAQNVGWPWSQFQHTTLNDKQDMFKMLSHINKWIGEAGEAALPADQFTMVLETWWPKLQASLNGLPPDAAAPIPQRSEEDMLIEILEILRSQQRASSSEYPAKVWQAALAELTDLGRVRAGDTLEARMLEAGLVRKSPAKPLIGTLQIKMAEALESEGHKTAARTLLDATVTVNDDGSCIVGVPLRPAMASLTFNSEAESIMLKAAKAADIAVEHLSIVPLQASPRSQSPERK